MEIPALDGIRDTVEKFNKFQAPAGTSCALHNVLIQHEAIREQHTSSRSHIPTALAATVGTATRQSVLTHAQTRQRHNVHAGYDDQTTNHYASEDASGFDMNLVDDEYWAFVFANSGFNIGQGAFMSPT